MCVPMAAAAVVMGVLTVVGGVMQYQGQKAAMKYNDQVARQNVKVAEAQAVDAERLGQIEASEQRLKTRLQMASQQVGFSAQGVDASTGTALDILGDTAMFGEIDVNRIRANAARKAWGFRMSAYDLEAQRRIDKYQGKLEYRGTVLTTLGKLGQIGGGVSWGGGAGATGGGGASPPVGPVYGGT